MSRIACSSISLSVGRRGSAPGRAVALLIALVVSQVAVDADAAFPMPANALRKPARTSASGSPSATSRPAVPWRIGVAGRATWFVAEQNQLPPESEVVPQLYATGFAFAEGPALNAAGDLFVVNYRVLGTIGRIAPDGTASIWCDLEEQAPLEGRDPQANGLKVDSEGRLIVADSGGGRLLRISADGQRVEVLADRWEGQRFRSVNDVALDLAGNIYFTEPGNSSPEQPVGDVYRYDIKTKRVSRLDTGLAYPNGLAVHPDQKHLVVAETQRHRLVVYDLQPSGEVANRRVLTLFPPEDAEAESNEGDETAVGPADENPLLPGGMVFDSDGRLYVAMWTGARIYVVDFPEGKILRQYDAGGTRVTNCHFHGGYLYTTVAAKEAVFRLKLDVEGFRYNAPR